MLDIKDLIKDGEKIKEGLKFVPSEPGIIRTYTLYKLEDGISYNTWKNQAIIYFQNILKDKDSLFRFEEQANKFETHHYHPKYLDAMLGILNAYEIKAVMTNYAPENEQKQMNRVFIVHGHAEAVNQEVARTIERLGLEAVILREQPNIGKTIIEKFEANAKEVNFAIILLTADDKIDGEDAFRARQNVIFEMGYFMGALGRKNVMCMLQENVEKPGDIDGVVYTLIDRSGVWKYSLVKELKACGYEVDANKII